ncbi:MAG: 30S ribosomal protein S20 [Bacteroidota bacterium]
MAQHASAAKQARQALKHKDRNQHYMSLLKTTLKRVRAAKEKDKATAALQRAVKLLDQFADKGFIHKNKAANQKSSLTKYVNSIK